MTAYYIGPFQDIVNVGWPSAGIGVLELSVRWRARVAYGDNPALFGMPFGTTFPVFASQIKFPGDLHVSTIVITPEMNARGFMWSYAPYINSASSSTTETATVQDQGTYFFTPLHSAGFPFAGTFTNSTVDGLGIAGAPFGSPAAAAAEYFVNQYNPAGGGGGPGLGPGTVTSYFDAVGSPDPDEITHTETVTITSYDYQAKALVFFNLAKLKAQPATSFEMKFHTAGASASQNYQWSSTFKTYKGQSVFLATVQNVPLWAYPPIGSASVISPASSESSMAAYTTTYDVDLASLNVSGNRVIA